MKSCVFCKRTFSLVYADVSFLGKDPSSTDVIEICLDCGKAIRSFIVIYNIQMSIDTKFDLVEEIEDEEEYS